MISIKIIDKDNLSVDLGVIGGNLLDQSAPLTEVLEMALAEGVESIESQGGAYGDDWADMSPWTPIVAQTLYGSDRDPGELLMDSGSLVGSLVRGAPGNVFEVGAFEGEAGTGVESRGFPLGIGQQEGTARTFHVLQGEGFSEPGIPGRQFLGWHEEKADDYIAVFARHVLAGIESPGFMGQGGA